MKTFSSSLNINKTKINFIVKMKNTILSAFFVIALASCSGNTDSTNTTDSTAAPVDSVVVDSTAAGCDSAACDTMNCKKDCK